MCIRDSHEAEHHVQIAPPAEKHAVEWIVFACFVPAAVITFLVLNSVFFGGRGNLYVVLGLVASIFAVGYLVLLRFGMNFWQLFLIVIPAEAVVYFSFHIRAKH